MATKNEAITLSAIAAEARSYFEKAKRDVDGSEYYRTKDDAPDWIKSTDGGLVYAAHNNGNMFPDDWRYEAIYHVLGAIEDADKATKADIEDDSSPDELLDSLVDVYSSELSKWLASNIHRAGYVEDGVERYGAPEPFDLWGVLQRGQLTEYTEIYEACLEVLETERENREGEEE
jgi:hypothetical protein